MIQSYQITVCHVQFTSFHVLKMKYVNFSPLADEQWMQVLENCYPYQEGERFIIKDEQIIYKSLEGVKYEYR